MARFSWFGDQEHRVYNHKPIYYDAEKEELRKKFGHVDGSAAGENYTPGSFIQGSFRDGNYARRRGHFSKFQIIINIISLILVVAILIFITRFYSLL